MTNKQPFARRVAMVLVTHAANALPNRRADWAHAIRNEIQHVSGDFNALGWALGCVIASYSERINAVNTRQTVVTLFLSLLGLFLVYASVVAPNSSQLVNWHFFCQSNSASPGLCIGLLFSQ